MKALIAVLAVGAALASGAWVWAARSTERAVAAWLDARSAEGWVVNRDGLDTSGYPTRFTTVLTDLELADPDTGWVWTAPRFVLDQRVWALDKIRAEWPPEQSLASPLARLTITAAELTAYLDVALADNLALDAARATMRDVALQSDGGDRTDVALARSEVVRLPGAGAEGGARYSVDFIATDITPPAALTRLIDPEGGLPATLSRMRYAAEMAFARPWDLSAVEVARPQITAIALEEMRAEWGPMSFRATGALTVDGQGRATGEMALRAENWRQMLAMGGRAGVVGDTVRDTVEAALSFVARLSGRPEDIDATLRFDQGFMFLGPIPIGEGPRFVLR